MKGSMQALAGATPAAGSTAKRYVDAFHRFDAAGGRVRFFGIEDPDKIETNVEKKLKRLPEDEVLLRDLKTKADEYRAAEEARWSLPTATTA